jgi:hypothetical protein
MLSIWDISMIFIKHKGIIFLLWINWRFRTAISEENLKRPSLVFDKGVVEEKKGKLHFNWRPHKFFSRFFLFVCNPKIFHPRLAEHKKCTPSEKSDTISSITSKKIRNRGCSKMTSCPYVMVLEGMVKV